MEHTITPGYEPDNNPYSITIKSKHNPELGKKIIQAMTLINSASQRAQKEKGEGEPIEVCYSGGKDSDVLLHLVRETGVPYRAIYKNTTIDPPGTIAHVKENNVEIWRPDKTFFQLVREKGLPNRFYRFCCSELKEYKILDYAVIGVRACESLKRKKRYKEPTECRKYPGGKKSAHYFPLLNWTDEDIKEYIEINNIKLAPIYYFPDGTIDITRRLGCLACPLLSKEKRIIRLKKYPGLIKQLAKNIRVYMDNNPEAKSVKIFKNEYEKLFMDIFSDNSMDKYYYYLNGFWGKQDAKKLLEDYFKIKF